MSLVGRNWKRSLCLASAFVAVQGTTLFVLFRENERQTEAIRENRARMVDQPGSARQRA